MSRSFTIQDIEQLQKDGKIRGFTQHAGNSIPETEVPSKAKRQSKYGNKKVECDGHLFDSMKEMNRYLCLKQLLKKGEIGLLEMQVVFPLYVNKKCVAKYIADFRYVDSATGNIIVEDVKGFKTRMYNLKKKLMKTIYAIDIKEV